jgi:hypothetical protein
MTIAPKEHQLSAKDATILWYRHRCSRLRLASKRELD